MKGIDFLDGLNEIDIDYVQEAEEQPRLKKSRWGYVVSIAACLTLMVVSGIVFGGAHSVAPPLHASDGVASMIASPTGLFWMAQIVGGLGIVFTIVVLIRNSKKQAGNEGDV